MESSNKFTISDGQNNKTKLGESKKKLKHTHLALFPFCCASSAGDKRESEKKNIT